MQKKTSSSGIDGVIRKQYTSMYADLLYSSPTEAGAVGEGGWC